MFQYDCESDGKSDSISTSDCQMRQSKKMKNSNELKKTPSNVTTTTLVTASRLPRVQHWEHGSGDKQAKNNWEFPRANLKMKTILGQGNFGQVITIKNRALNLRSEAITACEENKYRIC